jgi:uncharacterized SAM-binding protein YcdF (DUF218 family)
MLILNKILPVPFLPIGLTLFFILLGMVTRRRLPLVLGALVLWMSSMPLVANLIMGAAEGSSGQVPATMMQQADAIVVLSGVDSEARCDGAVELFKAGKAPLVVFTDTPRWELTEESQREMPSMMAVLQGVPPSAIRLTRIVTNTADEALAAGKMFGVDKVTKKKIILVTSAFHMRRSALLFERAGFEVERYPVAFQEDESSLTDIVEYIPDADALARSSTALREFIGWLYYWVRG